MKINNLEEIYDNLSYATKEFAEMPMRFYQLDPSVVNFLEDLVKLVGEPDQCDNIEDVQEAKHLLDEVTRSLSTVLSRLGENND